MGLAENNKNLVFFFLIKRFIDGKNQLA